MAEQAQAMSKYEITFDGHNAQGALPLKTVIEAVTRKAAIRAFIAQYKPTGGWLLGDPLDVTEREKHKEAQRQDSDCKK